jgi:tRNA(Ile)-lysidine synthase
MHWSIVMTSLPDRVVRRWADLAAPGVVAVSGGADSVALLRCFADRVRPLTVAHLNHRLRGADSDGDEQFVRELARSLDLEFRSIAIDVKEAATRDGVNLEDAARRARYEWFTQVARERGAAWIATGHTANDQAETVLHRLVRGAGMQGLRAIAPQRELSAGIALVRPLLHVSRAEVVAWLESLKQSWREDATNYDRAFTRNRIRHELLPLLKTFNPAIVEVLGRLAEQAGEIFAVEEEAVHVLLKMAERPRAGSLCIVALEELRKAPRHRIRGMFRMLWVREGWPLRDMTFEHWKRLVGVALGEESAVDLPSGITARHNGKVVQIGRRS